MGFKDTWKDKVNGVDVVDAADINSIAQAVIEQETTLPTAISDALEAAKNSGAFDGKSAYEYAKDGGYTGTEEEFSEFLANAVDKRKITLGLHTDGLIYLFIDGSSVGNGIALPSGVSGDVVGNVDSANNIVLTGNLADGTYTVKYEMQNGSTLDIGELKFHYSVTNTLTNCVSSNNSTSAANGGVYSATISANDGYELRSIVVTMDDEDISSTAVSGDTISIESVKGDIVITATATEAVVATNFFKATPTVNTKETASQDALVIGGRYGSDMGYRVDAGPNTLLSNYIPVQNGDEVYITNLELAAPFSGLCANIGDTKPIGVFSSSNENGQVTELDTSGDIDKFKIANASANYVRICGKPSDSIKVNASGSTVVERYDCSKIIVNIKRNGEWL